jgi:hypothetical protein
MTGFSGSTCAHRAAYGEKAGLYLTTLVVARRVGRPKRNVASGQP